MKNKHYKLYLNTSEPTSENLYSYSANFIGQAIGNIDSGAQVISNLTSGTGNHTGFIAPQKTGIFSLYDNVLIKPSGERLTFQNTTGAHNLSFLQAFLQFVLQTPVTQISGDSYEGLDGHKGYVLTFTANGKSQKLLLQMTTISLLNMVGQESGVAVLIKYFFWNYQKKFTSSLGHHFVLK